MCIRDRLEAVAGQFDESAGRIVVQLANTGMDETIRNTPVGEYSREVSFTTRSGRLVRFTTGYQKLGGTLKREMCIRDREKDRRTGEYVNRPIDTFNHHIDSIRYGIQPPACLVCPL